MAQTTKQAKTLLVDFDIAAFKYAWTHEFEIDWADGTKPHTRLEIEKAKYSCMQFIDKLMKRCKCDKVILFITGSFNFRYRILPTYKHNRQDVIKPQLVEVLKEWAQEEYETVTVKGLEADDLLGIYATRDPDNTVLATIDKDLKQIPCNLYLWNHDTLEKVSIKDADYWFYRQILTGDATDGYTGCPGIGPKKAEAILKANLKRDWWKAIMEAYEAAYVRGRSYWKAQKEGKKTPKVDWWSFFLKAVDKAGGVEEYALQQARVARILRNEDYNPTTQEPILWKPN